MADDSISPDSTATSASSFDAGTELDADERDGDFDCWAAESCALYGLAPEARAAYLGNGARAERFVRAEAHFSVRIAAELLSGPSPLARRYARLCHAARGTRVVDETSSPATLARTRRDGSSADGDVAPTQRLVRAKDAPPLRMPPPLPRTDLPQAVRPSVWPAPLELGHGPAADSSTAPSGRGLDDSLALAAAAVGWPIEQYARLRAELAFRAQERDIVIALHGLDPLALAHLEDVWAQRFEDDPGLVDTLRALEAYYRELLERGAP